MTRTDRFQSRVAFTLALMLAIAGIVGGLRVSAAPASAQVINSVVVSCDAPGADGSTACVISAAGAEQLAVPAAGVCGTVLSSSGAFDGASYVSASGDPSVALTFATPVAAGGAATYTVTTGGVATAIGGAGIVCVDAPAPPVTEPQQPQPESDVVDVPVDDETVSEEPATGETATESVDGETPADGEADGDETGSESDTTETDATGTEPDGAVDPTDTTDQTGETTDGDGSDSIGDGTGDLGNGSIEGSPVPGDGTSEGDETAEESVVVPANVIVDPDSPDDPPSDDPVTVTIVAYQCATDPGTADPASTAGCAATSNLVYSASDGSGDLGSVSTDATGTAVFTSTVGSSFIVTQTSVNSGYQVRGDRTYEVLSLDGDITITYVNVLKEELGRLQIVAQLCLTGQASGTEFIVPDTSSFGTAAVEDCGPNADALFTLTSGAVPGGSMVVRVDATGVWRGYIPAGDYVVTAPDGTTSEIIQVSTDYTAVAVAVTREHQDQGTLSLELFLCDADDEQIVIDPAGGPGGSCGVTSGVVIVTEDGAGGVSEEITVTEFGPFDVILRPGVYWVTGPQGVTTSVTVNANATSVARVLTIASSNEGPGNPDPGNGGGQVPGDGTGNPIGQPSDGSNGGSGDGTGIGGSQSDYGSNSVASVTQLPNTGSGASTADYWWPVLLMVLAGGLALTGYRLRPQVARRRI